MLGVSSFLKKLANCFLEWLHYFAFPPAMHEMQFLCIPTSIWCCHYLFRWIFYTIKCVHYVFSRQTPISIVLRVGTIAPITNEIDFFGFLSTEDQVLQDSWKIWSGKFRLGLTFALGRTQGSSQLIWGQEFGLLKRCRGSTLARALKSLAFTFPETNTVKATLSQTAPTFIWIQVLLPDAY